MTEDQELRFILEKYIDGRETLQATREYVILHLGPVANRLVDLVSMEIWHYEDRLITEDELKGRLGLILGETGGRYFFMWTDEDSEGRYIVDSTSDAVPSLSEWTVERTQTIHSEFSFA